MAASCLLMFSKDFAKNNPNDKYSKIFQCDTRSIMASYQEYKDLTVTEAQWLIAEFITKFISTTGDYY